MILFWLITKMPKSNGKTSGRGLINWGGQDGDQIDKAVATCNFTHCTNKETKNMSINQLRSWLIHSSKFLRIFINVSFSPHDTCVRIKKFSNSCIIWEPNRFSISRYLFDVFIDIHILNSCFHRSRISLTREKPFSSMMRNLLCSILKWEWY